MLYTEKPLDLLMSIVPVVGRRIMIGRKKYEYRWSIFRKPVNRVYLYLSSPEKKITGYFKYGGYRQCTARQNSGYACRSDEPVGG
jgi:predicted transcriptional regulator